MRDFWCHCPCRGLLLQGGPPLHPSSSCLTSSWTSCRRPLSWRSLGRHLQHGRHHDSLFSAFFILLQTSVRFGRQRVWQHCRRSPELPVPSACSLTCSRFQLVQLRHLHSYFIATYSYLRHRPLSLTSAFWLRLRWLKAGLFRRALPLLLRQRRCSSPLPSATNSCSAPSRGGRKKKSVAHPEPRTGKKTDIKDAFHATTCAWCRMR